MPSSPCWRWFLHGGKFWNSLFRSLCQRRAGNRARRDGRRSVDKSALGSAYGLIQAMDSAGAIAGPLLALAIIGHFGMRGVFASAPCPEPSASSSPGSESVRFDASRRCRHGRPHLFELNPTRQPPKIRLAPQTAAQLLLRSGLSHPVFTGEFQRHVPGAARGKHRHSGVARTPVGTRVQHHVHVALMAAANSATASPAPRSPPPDISFSPSSILSLPSRPPIWRSG